MALDRALGLNNEYAGSAARVRDVLATYPCVEHVPRSKLDHVDVLG